MKCGSVLGLVGAIGCLLLQKPARAFEREWHVGGGAGVTAYSRDYSTGPVLALHAAYGISDVFDVRLELLGSYHRYAPSATAASESAEPFSAAAGLAYKLDVLQWIPYGALLVGYQHLSGRLPAGSPFGRDDALVALELGLDYAMTRNFGLGAAFRTDFPVSSPSRGESFTTLLRAEYHWGF